MTAIGKPRATPKPRAGAAPASAANRAYDICAIRIELRHTKPLIWREVEVPTSITLTVLHDIVQLVMGWFDCHLWEFTIHHRTYGLSSDDDWGAAPDASAAKTRLRDVLGPGRTVIDYTYDMGDDWEHRLIVTKVRQGDPNISYPRYIAGEWAAPPEDCGGVPGFYEALEAIADPDHPEHAENSEWFDGCDPALIDLESIDAGMERIAKSCKAARTRAANKAKAG